MKKISYRDIGLIAMFLLLGIIMGWLARGIRESFKEPLTIENPVNTALIKRSDSLEAVVIQRDLQIANNHKQQLVHDSVIIMNNKALKNDYDKIKNLDDSTRMAYVDSVLKKQGIRPR